MNVQLRHLLQHHHVHVEALSAGRSRVSRDDFQRHSFGQPHRELQVTQLAIQDNNIGPLEQRRPALVSHPWLAMHKAAGRHLQQSAPSPQYPQYNWGGGASLNYGSRVGFAAGAAIGIILLICILILVCDRRRRPYVGSSTAQPLGVRHLYATQAINSGPKQVQYPVAVVNPDNEVECGRKILLDGTPSAKQNSADYYTSVGPGPPLFAAIIPYLMPGPVCSSSGPLQAPSGSLFQSFKQRFRPSDASQPSSSHDSNPAVPPLHTSDGFMPGGMPSSIDEPMPSRASFRSPFANWNPATGLANDTNQRPGSLELAAARSVGTGRLPSRDNIV